MYPKPVSHYLRLRLLVMGINRLLPFFLPFNLARANMADRFGVESTESGFSAVGRPKRVKSSGEKLYAPTGAKYSLQVKIFEFYPSGRTPVESTKAEFSAVGWPKRVRNPREKLYAPLVQSSEVPGGGGTLHSAEGKPDTVSDW